MENNQILKKVFQKAIDGGWNQDDKYGIKKITSVQYFPGSGSINIHCISGASGTMPSVSFRQLYNVIFSHSFAKALWGDKMLDHLRNMAAAPDRVKYLGENI